MKNSHEVDYTIKGDQCQSVGVELDPNESVVAESGSLLSMDDGIEMNTILGDGSNSVKRRGIISTLLGGGIIRTLLGASKRVVVGESKNFIGARDLMESHGVEVIDLNSNECFEIMKSFIEKNPDLWNEDIGLK